MKLKLSFLTLLIFISMSVFAQQPKVIAHRGFWKTAGSAQNSITSLCKADSIHAFGSEFDIWITADNKIVVNHDPSYQKVVMETAKYKDVKKLKLKNGECIPTLKSYLKKAKKLNVQMILEVKSHKNMDRQNACIDATLAMVKKMKMENRMTYIAFSLDAVKRLIEKAPKGTEVYYLSGGLSPKELKAIGCAGPDYEQNEFKTHPNWIKETHDLGMKVNVWTVDSTASLQYFIDNGADYITTNEPVLLQKLLSK